MRILLLPVISARFNAAINRTIVDTNNNGSTITVFANGDQTADAGVLCNVVVNEPGDTFVASADSKTIDEKTKKPVFMKGDTVKRQKVTHEFKSFAGNNRAAEFAQAASGFGLQLIVQMGS